MQFSIMEYVTIAILRDIYNYLFIKLYIVPLIYLQFSKNSRIFFFFFFFSRSKMVRHYIYLMEERIVVRFECCSPFDTF